MKALIFFLSLFAAQLSSASLLAQQAVVLVNGQVGTSDAALNGRYSSVTTALANNTSGPLTVFVEGMTHNGAMRPYSETPHPLNPNEPPEGYPINVRSGVEIRLAPSSTTEVSFTTVFSAPVLFKADGSGSAFECRLESISLFNASLGFEVVNTTSAAMDVECQQVSFINCGTGLQVHASGGGATSPLNIRVRNCKIVDDQTRNPSVVPNIGLEFLASESGSGSVGRIDGTVVNLRTYGDFSGTETQSESKLIKVLATGAKDEHEVDIWGIPSTVPIAQVLLDIQGGLLEGHNKDGGWLTGIYAEAKSTNIIEDTVNDYSAGYRVSTSGVVMRGFIKNGVEATVSFDARGEISLNGGTRVLNTTSTSGLPQAAPFGTGVYCHNVEGYLALRANMTKVSGNATHGIMLDNQMSAFIDNTGVSPHHFLPEGLYLDLEEVQLSGNQGDGLHTKVDQVGGHDIGGVVGGTRYYDYSPTVNQYFHSPYGWAQFPNGQGRVVRSAIHNNRGKGISMQVKTGAASFRLTRSVLWNNWEEGWRADLFTSNSFLACPIAFSTLAGNGDEPGANASVSLTTGSGAAPNLQLRVAPTFTKLLHTKFLHTIFARKNQTGGLSTPDFGEHLSFGYGPPVVLEEVPGSTSSSKLYMTGCRDTENLLGIPSGQDGRWMSFLGLGAGLGTIPFVGDVGGAVVWTSANAEQFRFGDVSTHSAGGVITNWLGNLYLPASDYIVDFRGTANSQGFTGLSYNSGIDFITNKGAFED
jgi:hypothetical protein